jgi:iron complex transport system substrate-binding protein
MISRRVALRMLGLSALALGPGRVLAQAGGRDVTDSAGRKVTLPAKVERVFAAGSPAGITLYTLVPDKLVGWSEPLPAAALAYLPPRYASLPVTGRLTGRANTANVEAVLAAKPDLVIDIGTIAPIYASLADRVQEQTGIPYLLFDGALDKAAELYRQLGGLLGAEGKAHELGGYADDVLNGVKIKIAAVPEKDRPHVYYARGPKGLETGLAGSINGEMLDFVGAINVAATGEKRNLASISPEQILAWDPDTIITVDEQFYRAVWDDPIWRGVRAERAKRIYLAPDKPFSWFDSPPAANRLIGLRWLCSLLYPKLFPEDLHATTRDFYRRFYHDDPSDEQLKSLLETAS